MVQVGFEPTPPKRLELESSALDRSATEPFQVPTNNLLMYVAPICLPNMEKKATNGIRTHDLSLTKRVLYQLSYSGTIRMLFHLQKMENAGFDPAASSLRTTHSTD